MSDTWKVLTPHQKRAAEQSFEALTIADDLMAPREENVERPYSMSDLYACATGATVIDAALNRELLQNPALQNDMRRLLAKTTICQFPMAAAASDGQVNARDGDGFSLRLKPSKAAPDQIYIIISLSNFELQPKLLCCMNGTGGFNAISLPMAQDGVIQVLDESASKLVVALRDVKSEVYLA